ncbi:hypothetical protein, unknown function [Leishmania tarentolae]|uniref:P27 protein n=1 Tax=Leishmania tarentolae TaxID=5689 RepID=A0A640KQ24_LEITA|nr:hypothetical protein, unknown function [Leishmania tarentolae]
MPLALLPWPRPLPLLLLLTSPVPSATHPPSSRSFLALCAEVISSVLFPTVSSLRLFFSHCCSFRSYVCVCVCVYFHLYTSCHAVYAFLLCCFSPAPLHRRTCRSSSHLPSALLSHTQGRHCVRHSFTAHALSPPHYCRRLVCCCHCLGISLSHPLPFRMSRVSNKISGGMACQTVVNHGYYLKPMTGNPYLCTQHDGVTTAYQQGFAPKDFNWLYRFRYNLLPQGMSGGFFSRNPYGRYVHWLEVSTIEKMRLQMFTMESVPCSVVSLILLVFTMWHSYRLAFLHPDITLYNLGLWSTKPWVQQQRFNKKKELDQDVYRWMTRVPEVMMDDPIREMYKMGITANDPVYAMAKEQGVEHELTMTHAEYTSTSPDIRRVIANARKDVPHSSESSTAMNAMIGV